MDRIFFGETFISGIKKSQAFLLPSRKFISFRRKISVHFNESYTHVVYVSGNENIWYKITAEQMFTDERFEFP